MGTIDDIIHVRDVVVPDNTFKSTRVGKSRTKTDEHSRLESSRTATRTYAAFPSPYQQPPPGTPSTNPVLMHEPYQRRDQVEYYREHGECSAQRSPSPASPGSTRGQYFEEMAYSRPSRSNSYVDHGHSPVENSPYSPHYQLPPAAHPMVTASGTQNYSIPRTLSPPWVNHDSYYYASPNHSGPASPPSAPPMPYQLHGHSSQLVSPRSHHPSYTPSSLESALTPQPMSAYRGVSLAPLQISPQHHTGARQCQTSPDSIIAMEEDQSEEDQSGLAPLSELKRPSKYRREPSDEKTLRLLIAAQPTVIRSPEGFA